MKTNLRHHVAQQLLDEQQWKRDNGPIDITVDQLWKYSGEIEQTTKDYDPDNVYFSKYYRKRIKDRNIYLLLNNTESRIIDYFYQNSDKKTIHQMGKDLNISPHTIQKTFSKHIKIQRNDKKNTG